MGYIVRAFYGFLQLSFEEPDNTGSRRPDDRYQQFQLFQYTYVHARSESDLFQPSTQKRLQNKTFYSASNLPY